jgi:hypothetical protein
MKKAIMKKLEKERQQELIGTLNAAGLIDYYDEIEDSEWPEQKIKEIKEQLKKRGKIDESFRIITHKSF